MVLITLFKFIKILLLLNCVHICFFKFRILEFGTENRYFKNYYDNALIVFIIPSLLCFYKNVQLNCTGSRRSGVLGVSISIEYRQYLYLMVFS